MRVDLAGLVAKAIGECLPQVALKGALVARLEDLEPLDDADEHFLDDVAGVDRAARAVGQPAAGPAVKPGEVAGAEQFYGVRITGTRPQQELERRLVFVHAPGQVDEGLPEDRSRHGNGRGQGSTRECAYHTLLFCHGPWFSGVSRRLGVVGLLLYENGLGGEVLQALAELSI